MRTLILRIILAAGFLAPACFAEFRAAIAVRVVTPDPLLPVSGGVGPSRPANRKLGELTVRALVLADDDTKVAIVSADFLGFPGVLADRVRARIQTIAPDNVLIGATHTHSAPDCYGFPDERGAVSADLKYLESVCGKMAEAIEEAERKLQPAQIRIASGPARGKIAYNYYAETLYDPRCHVIQALDFSGTPIATLVNYAIHPEVLGPSQGIVSPDLIGPLCERLKQRGAGTGLFMNSAQGGMITADCRGPDGRDVQTWDECVRIGQLLADEAIRIVDAAPIQKNPRLDCFARRVTFPVDSPMVRRIMEVSPLGFPKNDLTRITTRINLVNLGNAQILTIPGEALPNIGYYLKRKMRGQHNLLFGLTNDAFGYILTKVDWGSFKRYEYVTATSLGEMTGEILIDECLKLVGDHPAPESFPATTK